MQKTHFSVLLSLLLTASLTIPNAHAEENIFGDDDDSFLEQPVQPQKNAKANNERPISSFVESELENGMLRNLKKSEKVFCYTIDDYATPDYEGYIVNDMKLRGFCGEVSQEGQKLLTDMLLNNTSLYSKSKSRCNVIPKVMFRFINGLDHTDVLLSYPCPSLTFFQGRSNVSLNATPGKEIVEKIITAYTSLNEKYLSPALLGQLVGNGRIITQDQKEIVRRLSPTEAPLKKWNTEPETTKPTTAKPENKASGWNKLK